MQPPDRDQRAREEFECACDVFEARLTRAIPLLVENGFLFQAAMLTAIGIDALADSMMNEGPAQGDEYVKTIEHYFPDYAPYAERFYGAVRCGLVHRVQLTDLGRYDKDGEWHAGEGSAALADGHAPPRLLSDKLIIDVPHLVDAFFAAYNEFKRDPLGPRQRNFAKRMKQTVYNETPHGLIAHGAETDITDALSQEDRALLEFWDE